VTDWYKKSIEVFPENTVAHQNLAVAYSIQGKVESAIAEFQLVSKIDPSNPEGYYGLGSIYLDLDRPQEAISQLEKAEELYEKDLSPFLTDAQYALGVAHMMLEDYAKGRDYFESVYSDMEDNPAVNYNLGLCYLTPQLDNLDLAKKYFSKAQELGAELPAEVLQKLGK
jgi:tetratricopeptide (TPR) repeat protein